MKRSCSMMKKEDNRESLTKQSKLTTSSTDDVNITKEQKEAAAVSSDNGVSSEEDQPAAAAEASWRRRSEDPPPGDEKRTEEKNTDNNQPLIVELNNASVCMRDKSQVETIIKNMQRAGPHKLQVISDFDMTLTRFAHDGKRCPTTHNILHSSDLIHEDCKTQMSDLLAHYYPIEIDSSMPVEKKIPEMEDWWKQAHALLIKEKINKHKLAQAVKDSGAMLREGYKSFFDILQQKTVPLLIFSAGVGDILEEVIKKHQVFHSNVRVFSNYMEYDQDGVACKFKDPLIHTFNKREGALQNADQFVHDRTNVLLLGDSLGDLDMADGVKDLQNILRIGYLNDKVEERKESYVSSYDIVLVTDETLDVPNAVLKYITGSEEMISSGQSDTNIPATSQS